MSMIGMILGSFECTALLGKGGMGEVYRAKDQKLGRDVAIKVLPEEFAKDADRVARFQREAKLLASLNHPNIAAIYGLEESEGTHFLILELIEGDTLADRLKRGAIPVEEALKLALQIAEALEAAHEKGVIHRDLKPGNIKVTPDGKVKVLDFGLAKAFAGDQDDMNLSNSPTLSMAATQQGIILGTAAYMSPEQASGEAVDKRTDIWAFGVVVFEMLTGHSLFEGSNVSKTLASVIKSEPEWKSLPPNLHSRVRLLLERCLEKESKNRCSGISDARVEIQKVLADPSGVFAQPVMEVKPAKKKLRVGIPWMAAALVVGLIIAGLAVWMLKPSEPRQVARFYHELEEEQQFGDLEERAIAVSPDGTQFVYQTTEGLYRRSINELSAQPISGTEENPRKPFFSPDGQWVGYFAQGQLKKISINGGVPVTLAKVSSLGFLGWEADDRIVYTDGDNLMQISANGGDAEILVESAADQVYAPQILPDGKTVMFTAGPAPYRIMLQSLESGESKELITPGDTAQYLSTGHIVYGVDTSLYAIPFDLEKLETTGGSVPVVAGVLRAGGAPHYSISSSGALVYIPGPTEGGGAQFDPVWVDREGKESPSLAPPNAYFSPQISPDGVKVALEADIGGNSDIWIWDLERGTRERLTNDEGLDAFPLWTPDGNRVVFASNREGNLDIYWKAADGTGETEPIFIKSDLPIFPASLSPDGNTLVLMTGTEDIGIISLEGDPKWTPLLQAEYDEMRPRFSPDGKWIAYMSDETGQFEIYIRPFPDVNSDKRQVSTHGGIEPIWSPDGRELFYRNNNEVLMVAVKTEPVFRLEKPKALFQSEFVTFSSYRDTFWDIHPDGNRFLIIKPFKTEAESASGIPRQINIVLNWFEELKERVPVP